MALADKLAAPEPSKFGKPCSIADILSRMNDEDRATLLDWLGTPERRGLPAPKIYAALVEEGWEPGFQSINRHRSKPQQCRCRLADQ